jgi:hypothetical protein
MQKTALVATVQTVGGGAAIALADPVYLGIADESVMRKIIANGVRGTSMPAFAQSAGGILTEKQIDVITTEIRSRWSRPEILDGANPPLTRRRLREMFSAVKPPTELIVHHAMVHRGRVDQKAAPSRMIHFWRW